MHPYSSTNASREKPVAYIAIGCALLSIGLGKVIHELALPSYVGAPSAIVFFGAVFWLFDRYVWRLSLKRLQATRIPNLNGTWEGKIDVRKGKGPKMEDLGTHKCTVVIEQSWSRISIKFDTKATTSNSLMASLGPSDDERGGLRYEYYVKPKPDGTFLDEEETVPHSGVAHLNPKIDGDWKELTGTYYNDQDFQLWGSYSISRVKSPKAKAAS